MDFRNAKLESIVDIGNTVFFDICGENYTNNNKKGGFKPMIYCPARNGMDWTSVSRHYPLSIARYGLNDGKMNKSYPPETVSWTNWTRR